MWEGHGSEYRPWTVRVNAADRAMSAEAFPHRPPSGASPLDPSLRIRLTRPGDIPGVIRLSHRVYGPEGAWLTPEVRSHQRVFPEGQLVVVRRDSGRIVGLAVSLVIVSDAFPLEASWNRITARGHLTTHDLAEGDTLYGAGVAVHPDVRGMGVGRALYGAREAMVRRLGLARIRAGARISGYHRVAGQLTPRQYVDEVVAGRRRDPTLSFQLHMGFRVVAIAPNYLPQDRESRGHAAVVEWTPDPDGGIRG